MHFLVFNISAFSDITEHHKTKKTLSEFTAQKTTQELDERKDEKDTFLQHTQVES